MGANRFFHVNINVTNLDRLIAFYRLFGFEVIHREILDGEVAEGVARAFGEELNVAEYALVRLGDDPAATCLDLVQWRDRPTHGVAYLTSNHAGLYRILIHVADWEGTRSALVAAGHPPIGEVLHGSLGGGSATTMFCVRDPDGVVIEVASGFDATVA